MQTTRLDPYDLGAAIRRLPRELIEVMKKYGPRVIVAGGYLRSIVAGEEIQDIDLLVHQAEFAAQLANELAAATQCRTFHTDNAISIKTRPMIQVVHRWLFDSPEQVLNSFDFTIACATLWYAQDSWHTLCHPGFYPDLAAKRLRYLSPQRVEDVGGSMLRVLKFYQRGYRIPLEDLGTVIARLVSGVDPDKFRRGALEPEPQMAKVLTGLLFEVDPNATRAYFERLDEAQSEPAEAA